MFDVGDKVVYPMHGAGVIENIEIKKVLGREQEYYILKIPFGNIKVMVPVESSEYVGMRGIVSETMIDTAFQRLGEPVSKMPDNWNKRYRENMTKLKSGNLFDVVDVVKNLMRTEQNKGLSAGEKRMLNNAKQILVSEIVLVKNVETEAAETMVEEAIFGKKVEGLDNV